MKYDVVVIGAGILGCLTARELARYRLDILVIDKESDIGEGATIRESSMQDSTHAGAVSRGSHVPEATGCMRSCAGNWTYLYHIQAHCSWLFMMRDSKLSETR